MNYQYIPNLWPSAIATAITISLMLYAWKNRKIRGALPFFFTMLLAMIWIVCQALSLAATDLSTKIMWANIYWLAIMYAPVTYLILTITFTGRERWLTKKWFIIILLIVPLVHNALVWTNEWHSLMRQNVCLNTSGPFPVISATFGPLVWGFTTYNLFITIISLTILAEALRHQAKFYREQILLLFFGLLIPVLFNAMYITDRLPISYDPTPSILGLSGLLIAWGIFRYRLFDVIPVARSTVFEKMNTGVIIFDLEGRVVDMNPASMKMLNQGAKMEIGLPVEKLFSNYPGLLNHFHKKSTDIYELAITDNGVIQYYEVSFTQLSDLRNRPLGWLFMAFDITKRKKAEDLVRHMALHDNLTGLPNRKYFNELFSREIIRAERQNERLAVVFIDLDGFKQINDTLGHQAGDQLIFEVGTRLKGALRKSDIVSRYGSDEFVLLLPGIKKDEEISILGKKLIRIFDQPININNNILWVKGSIGISVYPKDGDNIDTLLKKADAAMYSAKKYVNNYYYIYSDASLKMGLEDSNDNVVKKFKKLLG